MSTVNMCGGGHNDYIELVVLHQEVGTMSSMDKKDLYAKLIDAINEFNTGGQKDADVPLDRVAECIGMQMMALAQVVATLAYTQGHDKAQMTQKILLMLPMLDQMASRAFDECVENDLKEFFPNVGKPAKE